MKLPSHFCLYVWLLVLSTLLQSTTCRILEDDSDEEEEDTSSSSERTRSAFISFAVGSVAIGLLVVATWCIVWLVDRVFGRGRFAASSLEENQFDQGLLSRKAHLWGLTLGERQRILPVIFETAGTLFVWTERQDEENQQVPAVAAAAEIAVGTDNAEATTTENKANEQSSNDIQQQQVTTDQQPSDDEQETLDTTTCCSICLTSFQAGSQVMTGTTCAHTYHQTCCLEWLKKNDHCPYCRQEMMTPAEFQQLPSWVPTRWRKWACRMKQ